MSVTIFKNNQLLGVILSGILLSLPMSASAKCGGVDYSWGADALANAHDYTVTMMLYVVYLSYAVAGLVAFQLFFGEGGRIRREIAEHLSSCR